jgi:nucleotide-binding universal stress UspA family protein
MSISLGGTLKLDALAAAKQYGNQLVNNIKTEIQSKVCFEHIESLVFDGIPSDQIIELARDWKTDLIVAGTHGRKGLNQIFMGSVSWSVLTHSPCSMVIARPSQKHINHSSAKNIVIALNEQSTADLLVDFVSKLNLALDSKINIIHVIDRPKDEEHLELINRFLEITRSNLLLFFPKGNIDTKVLYGHAASQIVEFANDHNAGLIVVGAHGERGSSRPFSGSVSLFVNSRALCSVVTVHIPHLIERGVESSVHEVNYRSIGSLRHLRLIAYLRKSVTLTTDEQRKIIEEYCQRKSYKIIEFVDSDFDRPGSGLEFALNETARSDGLIVCDLDRLVAANEDTRYELRLLIDRLWHNKKIIVSVLDGINTVTVAGQEAMIEHLSG